MIMKVDGREIYEVSLVDSDGNKLDWAIPTVKIEGVEMKVEVTDPPEPPTSDDYPELRNRAMTFNGDLVANEKMARAGDPPTMESISERHDEMMKSFGENSSLTVYAVVVDGTLEVLTQHHTVVENVVSDSLVEGEGATIDVQEFEVEI